MTMESSAMQVADEVRTASEVLANDRARSITGITLTLDAKSLPKDRLWMMRVVERIAGEYGLTCRLSADGHGLNIHLTRPVPQVVVGN